MKNKQLGGQGNNSSRDIWETPCALFDKLNKQYIFTFDCCANKGNTKVYQFSDNFETIKKENLELGMCWMNPPFSIADQMFKHFFKVVTRGVAIYRCDNMETKVWQKIISPSASWIFIPDKRIAYEGINGSGARFPSALIGYNTIPPRAITGTILRRDL